MILYVLGPTGVGKSNVCDGIVAQHPHIKYINLDKGVGLPNPGDEFWSKAKNILEETENQDNKNKSKQIILIDVGAGTLESEGAYEYFYGKHNVLVLYDEPENVLKRLKENRPNGPWANATVAQLQKVEYAPNRRRFYALGNQCNVKGLTKEEAAHKFFAIFKSMANIPRN
jgi:shikimate kinase